MEMKRHVLTLLILVAALAAYIVGFRQGAGVLIGLGCALELWFWVRAARASDPKPKSLSQGA